MHIDIKMILLYDAQGDAMDYKQVYFLLFNRITDALCAIENSNYGTAKEILIKAQQETEEIYMDNDTEENS